MVRRCMDCDTLITKGSRCPTHQHKHRPPDYTHQAALWVATHPRCVHCGTTTDLTAGHLEAGNARAGFQTECRACNNRARYGLA